MIYVIRGSEDGNLGATHSAHRAIQRAMEYLGTKDVSMGYWASDPDQRHRATQKEIKEELSEATVVTLVARKSGGWNPTTVDIEAFRPL